jgi:ECF sigma factor
VDHGERRRGILFSRQQMESDTPGDMTVLLQQIGSGDPQAADKLVSLVLQQLRELARHYLRTERPGHTLQPIVLVSEAYLRLVGRGRIVRTLSASAPPSCATPTRLVFLGPPQPVLSDVATLPGGETRLSFSETGSFLYQVGQAAKQVWPVQWMDSSGYTRPLVRVTVTSFFQS